MKRGLTDCTHQSQWKALLWLNHNTRKLWIILYTTTQVTIIVSRQNAQKSLFVVHCGKLLSTAIKEKKKKREKPKIENSPFLQAAINLKERAPARVKIDRKNSKVISQQCIQISRCYGNFLIKCGIILFFHKRLKFSSYKNRGGNGTQD